MHEMGIACSILDAVQKELTPRPGYRAVKVGVRIGRFAGVDGESLRFCFEAVVKGTSWEPLELAIEPSDGEELDLSAIEMDEIAAREEAA